MGRGTARQVIGALCGIGLVFGALVLLRSVPWPAVLHWLRSPTGLYVQSGAPVAVLRWSPRGRDVVRAEKNLAWLDYWFAELEQVTDTDMHARRAAKGDESFYEPLFQAEFRFRKLEGATSILAGYQSKIGSGRAWLTWTLLTWIGPALLLLGIVLAGTASLFGISVMKTPP